MNFSFIFSRFGGFLFCWCGFRYRHDYQSPEKPENFRGHKSRPSAANALDSQCNSHPTSRLPLARHNFRQFLPRTALFTPLWLRKCFLYAAIIKSNWNDVNGKHRELEAKHKRSENLVSLSADKGSEALRDPLTSWCARNKGEKIESRVKQRREGMKIHFSVCV